MVKKLATNALVTGWGRTEDAASSDVLLQLQVPVQGRQLCSDFFEESRDLRGHFDPFTHLCAGARIAGQDSCNGDSGGPLVSRKGPDAPWYQIGVVSFGSNSCRVRAPGVYTNVVNFLPWIAENMV